MKSIKNKILVVVIAGLFIMTVAVSAICFATMQNILYTDAQRILENRSEMEAAKINEIMNNVEKSVKVMEHFAITELFSNQALKIEKYRADYLEKMEDMFNEVALYTEGATSFRFRIAPEFSDNRTGFYKGIASENGEIKFKSYSAIDLTEYDREDVSNIGWYYTAIDAGKGVWMEPYKSPNMEGLLVSYVTPFYRDGKLLGVIAMDIDFSYFLEYVDNIKLYENGKTMLLTPDEKSAYISDGTESISDYQLKVHTKVKLINGMSLLLSADYLEIQSELSPAIYQVLGVFIVIMALFIFLGVITTNRIVAPLKKLTVAAGNLIDGKEVVDLPHSSNDEVGTLAVALGNAYQKITEYMNYINALAYKDSLTGLKNNTAYNEIIGVIDENIHLKNSQFAVILFDINNLKKTNDKYGHEVGNELIISAAKAICDTFKTESVYRIGGDEFVVILENADFECCEKTVAEFDKVCAKKYVEVEDGIVQISVARGVSVFDENSDKSFADVFNKADQAMYANKKETKNKI